MTLVTIQAGANSNYLPLSTIILIINIVIVRFACSLTEHGLVKCEGVLDRRAESAYLVNLGYSDLR